MRGHQDIWFHCKYCDKAFQKKKESLQKHMSLHTGQYKFKCGKCGKGFNEGKEYEMHIQTHT